MLSYLLFIYFFSIYFTPTLPLKPNTEKGKIEFDCSAPSLLRHCVDDKKCKVADSLKFANDSDFTECQVSFFCVQNNLI